MNAIHRCCFEFRSQASPSLVVLFCALLVAACGKDDLGHRLVPMPETSTDHLVEVLAGAEPLRMRTTVPGVDGALLVVRCGSCHRLLEDAPRLFGEVLTFHTGTEVVHGELSCESCHGEGDREHLRLADGQLLVGEQSIDLCSQCHGPQRRDYNHGAHGGMAGHWDLALGPRQRNRCTGCHAPHRPAYPRLLPAPGPNDRFLGGDPHQNDEPTDDESLAARRLSDEH